MLQNVAIHQERLHQKSLGRVDYFHPSLGGDVSEHAAQNCIGLFYSHTILEARG